MELNLLNLLIVLLAGWAGGRLAVWLKYPAVLGELLAGIVVGPALLGLVAPDVALDVLAHVGILLMMLYIGMEVDPKELKEASLGGVLAAIGGFVTPFALAFGVVWLAGGTAMAAIFVGLAAGVTSLATKSRILVDLKLTNTRIAHVMLAGAVLADGVSLIAFAAILGAGGGALSLQGLGIVAVKALAFFAVAGIIGWYGFPIAGRWLAKRNVTRTGGFTLVLLVAVAFAELAELAGLHGVLGSFVAGLFIRESTLGKHLSSELSKVVHDASVGFLAPIFFVTVSFNVTFSALREDALLLVVLVAVATIGKILGTMLFYLPTGNGWREGLVIGAGMNGRGAVEIILAGIALEAGIIDDKLFSILVFLAIFTTATVPVLLGWGTRWLRSRGELATGNTKRGTVVILDAGPAARDLGRVLGASRPVYLLTTEPTEAQAAREESLKVRIVPGFEAEHLGITDRAELVVIAVGDRRTRLELTTLLQVELGVPSVIALSDPQAVSSAEVA